MEGKKWYTTSATFAWSSGVRWSSKVIITGYGDLTKACSFMDFKHFSSVTGLVSVLQSNMRRFRISSFDLNQFKPMQSH